MHTDFAIMANRPSAGLYDGAQTYDGTTHVIRNILGIGGLSTHIFHNPAYPEDSRNGAFVVNSDNVGGSGIDPNDATSTGNSTIQAILLNKGTTRQPGLYIVNGCVVGQVVAQSIQTTRLTSIGMIITGNGSVSGTLITGHITCTGDVAGNAIRVGVC